MIQINELKELVEFLANKHQTGASITPGQFNIATQSALDDAVMYFYGLPQQYQPGAPVPAVAWEVTQLVTDYISHLKPTVPLTINSVGVATKPADYLHVSSISYLYFVPQASPADANVSTGTEQTSLAEKHTVLAEAITCPVDILDDAKWATRMRATITKPTKKYPVCRFNDNDQIEFAPIDLRTVQFTYIRYPVKPVWAYTTPDGYTPLYDATSSVNVEMPAMLKNMMCYFILTKLGINIREPQLQQFAELLKTKGV